MAVILSRPGSMLRLRPRRIRRKQCDDELAGARAAQKPSMDAALHDIYAKETSSHLTEIREYLRKRLGSPATARSYPESVYRAHPYIKRQFRRWRKRATVFALPNR